MLRHAEQTCRDAGYATLTLSTSELQPAALAFYRQSGYRLGKEEAADTQSNKTIGGGDPRGMLISIGRFALSETCRCRGAAIARTAA